MKDTTTAAIDGGELRIGDVAYCLDEQKYSRNPETEIIGRKIVAISPSGNVAFNRRRTYGSTSKPAQFEYIERFFSTADAVREHSIGYVCERVADAERALESARMRLERVRTALVIVEGAE